MNSIGFTGIKPTGHLHLGNEFGMHLDEIKQQSLPIMIADAHGLTLTTNEHAPNIKENSYIMTAELLSIGCNDNDIYRQSDLSEVFKLYWVLSTVVDDGMMRRMHAYKDMDAKGLSIPCTVYNYPLLMAADIIISGASAVFVGQDQVQHIEFTRVLVSRLQRIYGMKSLILPEAKVHTLPILIGLDGRKMSKSYNNTIPVICTSDNIKDLVYKIKTNSQLPTEPKEPETLFALFESFASTTEVTHLLHLYKTGIGWKEVKDRVIEVLNRHALGRYEKFQEFNKNRAKIDELWKKSAEKLRLRAKAIFDEVNAIF